MEAKRVEEESSPRMGGLGEICVLAFIGSSLYRLRFQLKLRVYFVLFFYLFFFRSRNY